MWKLRKSRDDAQGITKVHRDQKGRYLKTTDESDIEFTARLIYSHGDVTGIFQRGLLCHNVEGDMRKGRGGS